MINHNSGRLQGGKVRICPDHTMLTQIEDYEANNISFEALKEQTNRYMETLPLKLTD